MVIEKTYTWSIVGNVLTLDDGENTMYSSMAYTRQSGSVTYSISGTVTSADGSPLAGVTQSAQQEQQLRLMPAAFTH